MVLKGALMQSSLLLRCHMYNIYIICVCNIYNYIVYIDIYTHLLSFIIFCIKKVIVFTKAAVGEYTET